MKKITLALIGNVNDENAQFSIDTTLKAIEKDCETVFRHKEENFTIDDYSDFCLKKLYHHIKTEFVMIVQYDGMGVKSQFWSDNYFNYDYIGASWPERFTWIEPHERVGNGGFSLRSMKLLEALQDDVIQRNKSDMRFDAEDATLCLGHGQHLKNKHGIKFADVNLANMFSTEWCNPTGNSLGFHGLWNAPLFFSEKVVVNLVKDVNRSYWYSDRFEFFKEVCNQKRYFEAKMVVINKIKEAT